GQPRPPSRLPGPGRQPRQGQPEVPRRLPRHLADQAPAGAARPSPLRVRLPLGARLPRPAQRDRAVPELERLLRLRALVLEHARRRHGRAGRRGERPEPAQARVQRAPGAGAVRHPRDLHRRHDRRRRAPRQGPELAVQSHPTLRQSLRGHQTPMTKLLASALSLALVAASAAPALAAVKNPDTFVYATIGDPESLDPAWAYDSASHGIIDNVYETLLTFKGGGVKPQNLAPMLATKVPTRANGLISADGLTYRFPIRKGVKFHDGAAMTPEDVRYSLLRFMLFDRDGGPSSLLLEPLLGTGSTRKGKDLMHDAYDRLAKAVTVEGDDLVVRLPKPFAPFLTILATYGDIMEWKWCAAHGQWDGEAVSWEKYNNPSLQGAIPNTQMNGTGPFKLQQFESNTKEVVLTRWDGYWRAPARLKTVVIKVVDEFATRKLMLGAGDADSIYGPQMYFPQLQNMPGVELLDEQRTLDISPILFFAYHVNPVGNQNIGSGKLDGQGIPPDFFSDKDVRKGFAYSIDSEAYVRDIQRGKGKPASSFLPPSMLGYRAGKPKYSYDPKQAAEHFKKAWGGKVWD